jgi:hypothetical protein
MPLVTKVPDSKQTEQFTAWTTDSRETAFELWMSNGKPKIAKLVRIIEAETGERIPDQTLRDWHRGHHWDDEYDRRLAQLAPNMMIRGALDLTVAFVHAARYVRESMTRDEEGNRSAPFNRDEFAGAMNVCAAFGFSPASKSRPALPAGEDDAPRTLRALTDEELRRLERGESGE